MFVLNYKKKYIFALPIQNFLIGVGSTEISVIQTVNWYPDSYRERWSQRS